MSLSTQYQEAFEKIKEEHLNGNGEFSYNELVRKYFLPKSFIQEEIEKLKKQNQDQIEFTGNIMHDTLHNEEFRGGVIALSYLSSSLGLTK